MQRDDALQIIRREGDALLTAAPRDLRASVRGAPEWDVADLVHHVGEVHFFWATVVDKRLADLDDYEEPDRPADDALVPWARENLDYLLRVLAENDPAMPVWSWAATQQDVAFVLRRMAHETTIHRWDAEEAVGADAQIDPVLASDGVDEYLSFFVGPADVAPASVHLHSTDAPGEWLVRFGAGAPPVVTREHAKGDAAVRGPAADLILALWERVPLSQVDVVGDATAVERLFASAYRG